MGAVTTDLLWPAASGPADLDAIERVPLAERGLPASTYELVARAAELWPERDAVSVLPDGAQWERPFTRTFAELAADVHRAAGVLGDLGVRRGDAVSVISVNCAEMLSVLLAAEAVGIFAPINPGLSAEHATELVPARGRARDRRLGPGARARRMGARARDREPLRGPRAARAAPHGGHRTRARARAARGRRRRALPTVRGDGGRRRSAGSASGGLRRRQLPAHGRHDRYAQAGRAHARQRGGERVDDRRPDCSTRAASRSPRCPCSTPTRWW